MTFEDYTTVSKWADELRAQGKPCDQKWFANEIKEGRIPSILVAGTQAVRKVHLEEAYPRYRGQVRHSREQTAARVKEKMNQRRVEDSRAIEEIHDFMHRLDRQLEQIRLRVDLLLTRTSVPRNPPTPPLAGA